MMICGACQTSLTPKISFKVKFSRLDFTFVYLYPNQTVAQNDLNIYIRIVLTCILGPSLDRLIYSFGFIWCFKGSLF